MLVRCEECAVALPRDTPLDLAAEWSAVGGADAAGEVQAPNRTSIQAAIGAEGWAAIDQRPGRLLLGPASLTLLARHNGAELSRIRTPPRARAQGWMWQTLLNGLTFHANFAREVRAGRLRAATARSRFRFAADALVTVLAAPLVLLVSAPLELVAAALRRGGVIVAGVATRSSASRA